MYFLAVIIIAFLFLSREIKVYNDVDTWWHTIISSDLLDGRLIAKQAVEFFV